MKYGSKEECETAFLELCSDIVVRSAEIDDDTPLQNVEPQWWGEMIDIQKLAKSSLASKQNRRG